ncbi:RusA family crossover junction endodeoxyribonuclease [Erysipelothrix rhusiopathiae]|nr:RusA family crossover junction endodeoxyribonuclease [Erysipelothrix rhusiopathiae]MDE8200981.1 RusA family crossover junction endodeoxyribonuclease [Erysipelothrix rhusiopathiae]MDE8226570.1 RusA family crossover junction endodeoxyribonuclease [Erysipelothrix rhusiopathiae]MDE8229952.1 RusA family crossover junction endodeoxyribonuclease [Erysipelothrix rhusiopathiae]
MIEFFIPMITPTTTHQQKKVRVVSGKPVFYEPPKLKAARSKLMGYLYEFAPEASINGPIRLKVVWLYKETLRHKRGSYKPTKPDLDNMQKLLLDCMTDLGFWNDDAQIASMLVEKMYDKVPGIYIKIEELEVEV